MNTSIVEKMKPYIEWESPGTVTNQMRYGESSKIEHKNIDLQVCVTEINTIKQIIIEIKNKF